MIIKIERHRDDQRFWLLDNIEKVSISESKTLEQELCPYDTTILDHIKSTNPVGGGDITYAGDYVSIICRRGHDEIGVAFDTICYIMNDDGQTIEKIVVNYHN